MSENGSENRNLFEVGRNFRDGADETFHRTVFDHYAVANLEFHGSRSADGFDTELFNFSGSQGNGTSFGTDEAGGTRDVADDMPCGIGHDHFYENVAGENLRFAFLGNAFAVGADKEKYAPYILADIEQLYAPMLKMGNNTVWETELGEKDFDDAGSLCQP